MAINFVVSYTFSPSTTISSSQVNTNFSDEAGVWQGLEARTKSFAALQVDATPSFAADVVRKDYVDHFGSYRRPNLIISSGTVINIETGINGTSGQAQILFPDGNLRTDSTTGRINCNFAQVAALSGSAQSGLQTGTVSNNTWYAVYAVKVSDSLTNFVTVADKSNFPVQAKFATLNSNFGTNSWVYLGMARNGDNSGTAGSLISFVMAGNQTNFTNTCASNSNSVGNGVRLATSASATSITYAYSTGNGATDIPSHLTIATYAAGANSSAGIFQLTDSSTITWLGAMFNNTGASQYVRVPGVISTFGAKLTIGGASPCDIFLVGFVDSVLGVGPNPIL